MKRIRMDEFQAVVEFIEEFSRSPQKFPNVLNYMRETEILEIETGFCGGSAEKATAVT